MKHSPVKFLFDSRVAYRRLQVIAVSLAFATISGLAQAQMPQSAPLTLRAVLDSVSARYPLVLAAQARVRAAQGSRTTAGAFGNPIVSYEDDSPPARAGISGIDRERTTLVTLPLEPFYQRGSRVRRADAEVRAATDDAAAARQRAALDATRAYYRAALAQVSVTTSRGLLVWLDSLVAYNRSRAEQGVAAEADLIRSQLERDRAAADGTMLEAELAQAKAALSTFVGISPASSSSIVVAVDDRPLVLPVSLLASVQTASTPGASGRPLLQADSRLGRAEVRAARERVTAANAEISSQRSLLFRQIGATFGTKRVAGFSTTIAGLSLPFPLFDMNRGEVARASAEQEAASYELGFQERAANAEVSGAYEAARLLTERTTAMASDTSGFLARADEGRRIALGAYREGAVPLFQVIDAARAWGEARLSYYRILYAQHEGVAALLFAQGDDLLINLPALAPPLAPNR
jgi:cobalt-zinc-cadmium efflux system outer membrane protein